MNKQKKLVILLTLVLCIFIMPLQAFTATGGNHIVAPQWDNTSMVTMSLRCANYNAHCDVQVIGYSGTTKITGTVKLQMRIAGIYCTQKTWNVSASGQSLVFEEDQPLAMKGMYRLVLDVDVTRKGTTENIWLDKVTRYS